MSPPAADVPARLNFGCFFDIRHLLINVISRENQSIFLSVAGIDMFSVSAVDFLTFLLFIVTIKTILFSGANSLRPGQMWCLQKKKTFPDLSNVWESLEKAEQEMYEQRRGKAMLKQHQIPGHFRLTSFPAIVWAAVSHHPAKDPKLSKASQKPVSQIAKAIQELLQQNREWPCDTHGWKGEFVSEF